MTAFIQELFQFNVYKRSQGRITRQVTFAALAVGVALGCYVLYTKLHIARWAQNLGGMEYWLSGILLLAGLWIAFRVVNLPVFADFLISVEAEMNKVSWPTRTELFRGSLIVLVVLLVMAGLLYGFDVIFRFLFRAIGMF